MERLTDHDDDRRELKRQAAERAVELVEPGMVVGLGTGSTAAYAIADIGRRLVQGRLARVRGVPTSTASRRLAENAGIPMVELDGAGAVDLTIDGADEVDPALDLVKGAGGALLREKIVAAATRRNVIVVDASKLVPLLGTSRPVPVEVVPFGWRTHVRELERLGAQVELRRAPGDEPFVTDEGHLILDCRFAGGIADPAALDRRIRARPGAVETGLFLGLAHTVIVAGERGVEILERR